MIIRKPILKPAHLAVQTSSQDCVGVADYILSDTFYGTEAK